MRKNEAEIGPVERPGWVSEALIEQTLQVFQPMVSMHLTDTDAVRAILSVGQLLEATGLINMEDSGERNEEEVYGLGKSERAGTGA
jgi:hypothetical protein